jgi:hypothetical protein
MTDNRATALRSREQSIVLLIVGSLLTVGGSAQALLVDSLSPLQRGLFVTMAVLFGGYGVFRLARCGAYVMDKGVRVVNPLRTHFVPWEAISCFSIRRVGFYPGMGVIERKDASIVPIWGIQVPNPMTRPKNRAAQRLIEELNGVIPGRDSGVR